MSRIKSGIKKLQWLLQDLGFATALLKHKNAPQNRRMLVYHGVVSKANKNINARFIDTKEFEAQLIYFKKHFNLVSLDKYFDGATDKSRLTLCLTFDDGYLNNLNEVLPLLEKHQIPAAFFITTIEEAGYAYLWADLLDLHWHTGPQKIKFNHRNFTKKRHGYWDGNTRLKGLLKNRDWNLKKEFCDLVLRENSFLNQAGYKPYYQLLNKEEIKKLSDSPIATIGSHGLYHNCMAAVSLAEAKTALEKSKSYLEKVTNQEIKYFAYPDGSYNAELIKLAESTGYQKQIVVDYTSPEDATNPMLESRMGINPYISLNNQIKSIVDGKY